MRTIQSKIVNALNESMSDQFVEAERVVGVNAPKQVHQCDNCAEFYLVSETANESICPECGSVGHHYSDVVEGVLSDLGKGISNVAKGVGQGISGAVSDLTEDEEEELKSEADEIVTEALHYLDRNDYKKFNECYRPRVRMTKRGELQAIVESKNGTPITASRKMTSRQKTAYNLSEKYNTRTPEPTSNKKLESIRLSRQELKIKNESRAIKLAACRLLERQCASYDHKKFVEGMDKFIASRDYRKMLEDISNDEIGKSELDKMTPDEIGDVVTSVVADTGLDIVTNDVDIDGDTATVNVRVSDNDEQEVRTSEVEATLQDVFDAPVEVVGPYESEGDSTVKDLAIVINPDDDLNEEALVSANGNKVNVGGAQGGTNEGCEDSDKKEDQIGEGFDDGLVETDPSPAGANTQIQEEDEPMRTPENGHKFESRRMNLFALKLNESTDDAPKFLGQDDSLVEGDDEDAEEKARLFISEEAADKYLEDVGLDSEYTPKSVCVTEESLESEEDQTQEITEEGADEVIETDDGKYFKKDECFYKESIEDGSIEEVDVSEYEDAKSSADAEELKEAYRRKRSRRR